MRSVGAIHDAEDGAQEQFTGQYIKLIDAHALRQADGTDSPVLFHSFH
ncbi:MAG: hypothetical protein ACREXS_04375 [Gammaproteobacteria bacterium]